MTKNINLNINSTLSEINNNPNPVENNNVIKETNSTLENAKLTKANNSVNEMSNVINTTEPSEIKVAEENVNNKDKIEINQQSEEITLTNLFKDATVIKGINVLKESLTPKDSEKLAKLNVLEKLMQLYEKKQGTNDSSLKIDIQSQLFSVLKTIDDLIVPEKTEDKTEVINSGTESSETETKKEYKSVLPSILFTIKEKLESITAGIEICMKVKEELSKIKNDGADHSSEFLSMMDDLELSHKKNEISEENYKISKEMILNSSYSLNKSMKPQVFFEGLNDSSHLSKSDAIKNATIVMSTLHFEMPLTMRLDINQIYSIFCNGNPELNNLTEAERKQQFADVLSTIANAKDDSEVCNATDKLLRGCPHFNLMGECLKIAFTSKENYEDVIAQHKFSCAIKTLVESLPQKDAAKLSQTNYVTPSMLEEFSKLSSAPKFNYQLANVVVLQDTLIRNGLINVNNFVDPKTAVNNPQDVADNILNQFIKKIGLDEYIRNTAFTANLKTSEIDGFVTFDSVKELTKDNVLKAVTEMAENFSERNLIGQTNSNKAESTIKNTANSLTGTRFSKDYLTKAFDDMNVRNKGIHVFDGVVMQLTGKLDHKDRNIILDDDKSQTKSTLDKISDAVKKSVQKSLNDRIAELEGKDKQGLLRGMILESPKDEKSVPKMGNLVSVRDKLAQLDKNTIDNLQKDSDILGNLKNIRTKFISNMQHVQEFSVKNNECIRLHAEKKELNKEYKTQKQWYEKLTWVTPFSFKKRMKNAETIVRYEQVSQDLELNRKELLKLNSKSNNLIEQNKKAEADSLKQQIDDLTNSITVLETEKNQLKDKIKFINLRDLTGKTKNELSDEQIVNEAIPLAKALIYFKKGAASKDLDNIKTLKSQRDEVRKELYDLREEAKSVYGKETIRQVERAIMTAVYIRGLETQNGEAKALSAEGRNRIEEILTKNFGMSKSGVMSVLIDDTIRRYTDPKGNLTAKYLSLINQKMVRSNETSIVKTQRKSNKSLFKDHVNQATSAFINRSTTELLAFISKPGQSIFYSKESGVRLQTIPGVLSVKAGYTWDNSITVENTGSGYDVFIKSDKALDLAIAAGYVVSKAVKIEAEASIKGGLGTGVILHFDDVKNVDNFLKDFVNKDSAIHNPEKFKHEKPSWKCANDIKFVQEKKIEGGLSAGVSVGLSVFNKNKDLSTSVGSDYTGSIKLPNVSAKIAFKGSSGTQKVSNGTTTIETSESGWKVELEASAEPLKFTGKYTPYTDKRNNLLSSLVAKLVEFEPVKNLLEDLVLPEAGKLTVASLDVLLGTEEGAKALQVLIGDIKNKYETGDSDYLSSVMYAFTHDKLYRKIIDEYVTMDSSNDLQKASKIILGALNEYSKFTSQTIKFSEGQTTDYGKVINPGIGIEVDIPIVTTGLDYAGRGLKDLMGFHDDKVRDASKEYTKKGKFSNIVGKAGHYVSGAVKLVSTIDSLMSGNPLDVISSLGVPEVKSEVKGKNANANLTVGGSKLISGEIEGRRKYVEGGIKASLTEGVSAKISFGSTVNTKVSKAKNKDLNQFTADTGITYTVQKGQFRIDNALNILDLSDEFLNELSEDKENLAQMHKIFEDLDPTDTMTVETRITQKALNQVNSLLIAKNGTNDKQIDQQINSILEDHKNYVPVKLEFKATKSKSLKLRYELSDINIGVASFSHHRSMGNVNKYTFSFNPATAAYKKVDISPKDEETTNPSSMASEAQKTKIPNNSPSRNFPQVNGDGMLNEIKSDEILKQTPNSNTCFIMSIVNSLRSTQEGKNYLLSKFTNDNKFIISDRVDTNNQNVQVPLIKAPNGTVLESTIANIYEPRDKDYTYLSSYGEAGIVASMLGLETQRDKNDFYLQHQYTTSSTNEQLNSMFSDIQKGINDKQVIVCAIGTDSLNTHYVAVVDAKTENGKNYIYLDDSLTGTRRKIALEPNSKLAATHRFEFYSRPNV